jgi:beta-N-acetylhexosaminidase
MIAKAFIAGCSGLELTRAEAAFFRAERPWGFILFKRNVDTPDQVRKLVDAFRACVDRADAPVLIDQEGGRVQRLGPPHWPKYPPGRAYGTLKGNDPLLRREITRLGARLIAHDLRALGITVDCVPVLDIPVAGAHDVIGDRAYGDTPEQVAYLGRAAAEGLIAGGVLPIVKHIPGHGRAGADSHLALPVVDTDRATLSRTDFLPFRHLADMPMAMTAHVVYSAIDPKRPATTSRSVMQDVIRGEIGYDGLVMSDDLSMKALAGDFASRTRQSLRAGCDVVLHCNGDLAEMQAIAAATPELKGLAKRRAESALKRIAHLPEPFDPVEGRARLDAALNATLAVTA